MATVLITGCSSGFGKLTALEFARRGDKVFATMRDVSKAGSLLEEAKGAGISVRVLKLDVTDAESINSAVAAAIQQTGRLDTVVNNAAIFSVGPVEAHDDDELLRSFNTNVLGVIRVIRASLPAMRAQGSGTIINVGSMAGRIAWPPIGIYSATKGALEALSDALYYELHPFGIRVILIEPGHFATSMPVLLAGGFKEDSPYGRFAKAFDQLPSMGRPPGNPQVVGEAIVNAAKSVNPKRRYVVGEDAEFWCRLHKQLSDEEFERKLRSTLGFWD